MVAEPLKWRVSRRALVSRLLPSPVDAQANFPLMVPRLQALMRLFGLCQRKHLIEVHCELARLDALRQLAQLPPIRREIQDLCVNVPGGSHLLQVHNRGESPPIAHDLKTAGGSFAPHAVYSYSWS